MYDNNPYDSMDDSTPFIFWGTGAKVYFSVTTAKCAFRVSIYTEE